jgi:hypothetical protein
MELASGHSPGTWNSEVAPTFLEKLHTPFVGSVGTLFSPLSPMCVTGSLSQNYVRTSRFPLEHSLLHLSLLDVTTAPSYMKSNIHNSTATSPPNQSLRSLVRYFLSNGPCFCRKFRAHITGRQCKADLTWHNSTIPNRMIARKPPPPVGISIKILRKPNLNRCTFWRDQ